MSELIREINTDEFDSVIAGYDKVVVDFYSTECPPCEAFAGKFEKAAGLFGDDVCFMKIFRQANRALAEKLEVRSSPTVLFFKNGELQLSRFSGAVRQGELESGLAGLVGEARAKEIESHRAKFVTKTDVIILGGGPAGLTAGIYLSQAKLSAILLDTELAGGFVALTHEVSNYPGFADPKAGYELSHNMYEQARRFIVIASGSSPRKLGVPGETEFRGKGISYWSTNPGFSAGMAAA